MVRSVGRHTPLWTTVPGSVPRVDLAHFRTGSGPPLLLVHGLGMGNVVWRPLVPLLAWP